MRIPNAPPLLGGVSSGSSTSGSPSPSPPGPSPVPWQTPATSVVLGGQTQLPAVSFTLFEPAGQIPVPVPAASHLPFTKLGALGGQTQLPSTFT